MAYKENWIVIAMITTIKLVRASIFYFMWDQLVSQRVNDISIYQTFPYIYFIDRGTLTWIINKCNIFKK